MTDESRTNHDLEGTPARGLATATLGFAAGLTTIVFYGVAGPEFKEALGLSGAMLGLLLSSPHLTKALLRVPFGAWVDQVGGRKPFLVLLGLTLVGMGALAVLLLAYYPHRFDMRLFPVLVVCGLLAGAGGATFSVGVPKTSFWYPTDKQGYALGVYAGAGNVSPGLINYLMPVLILAWGLPGAYLTWFLLVLAASVAYAIMGVDAYYFQLIRKGIDDVDAREVARAAGQDVFPNGNSRESLKMSARNPRTWVLVFLYTVSFGGGFTALAAWFPTYFNLFHAEDIATAGLLAGIFTVYGSLIRIPGGALSDRWGGEKVTISGFAIMLVGSAILTMSTSIVLACVGMMVLATGMGVANAGIFGLVPKYVPDAVGGASGWIGGVGGAGTLIVLPLLGVFVDVMGPIGYARGFSVFVVMSAVCMLVAFRLKRTAGKAASSSLGTDAH